MSGTLATRDPFEADFEAIQDAVMETDRGRWFLAEYARRNRHADTDMLLKALGRIEKTVSLHTESSEIDRFRLDVLEMSRAIARTREEISAIRQPESKGNLLGASGELDSIVLATERATSDILAAGEQVQEVAWTLREAGADPVACDALDQHAVAIYTACSFQDLTAQRTRKVIEALAFIEKRVNAMADIWRFAGAGAQPVEPLGDNEPAAPTGPDMTQADVDVVLVQGSAAAQPVAPAAVQPPAPASVVAAVVGSPSVESAAADPAMEIEAFSEAVMPAPDLGVEDMMEAEQSSGPAQALYSDQAAVDGILFDAPAPPPLPEVLPPLKLVKDDPHAKAFLAKVRGGATLSTEEASAALDALKNMSVEERTKLFS